jgi:hypothetical protein
MGKPKILHEIFLWNENINIPTVTASDAAPAGRMTTSSNGPTSPEKLVLI